MTRQAADARLAASAEAAVDKTIEAINAGLDLILGWADRAEVCVPAVSAWSVGLQLEHALLVSEGIASILEGRAPATDTGINMIGRIVLVTSMVPRGKGQAPDAFRPEAPRIDSHPQRIAALRERLAAVDADLPALRADPRRFAHPAFGGLTRSQWLKLMRLHQDHHAAIVRDILAKQ